MINNLKLEFGEKSLDYLNGEPYRTRVVLKNDDGAYYPIFFDVDAIKKADAELYQMALEVVYRKNSANRAEDERFNLLSEKIAEYNKLIEKATLTIGKMEAQMTTQQEQSSMAQVTLMSVIFKLYEKGTLTDEDLTETTISEME